MTKQGGLGDALYVGGYDISGDINSIDNLSTPLAVLDGTDITMSAKARLPGLRDAAASFTAFFDNDLGKEHPVLSGLPGTDTLVTYCRGTVLGNSAFAMRGLEVGYSGTRSPDGDYKLKTDVVGDGYGGEWGQLLTAGVRTDTTATAGSSIDTLAAASFGWSAYLNVMAFTGTDATVKVQDSADNSSFADLTAGAFAQITSTTPGWQRIGTANGSTATVRRYLKATTVTTGGFTQLKFAVMFVKNTAVVVNY